MIFQKRKLNRCLVHECQDRTLRFIDVAGGKVAFICRSHSLLNDLMNEEIERSIDKMNLSKIQEVHKQ